MLAKYENEKLEELQSLMDIKLTTSLVNNNNNIGLSFTKSSSFLLNETPKRFLQMPTPERKSSLSKVRLLIYPSFSPKSESFNWNSPLIKDATIKSGTLTSHASLRYNFSHNASINQPLTPNTNMQTTTRAESSETDSQYFSGTDTSLVYADSSNYSAMGSVYSNYSVMPTVKAIGSLTQKPPSPPPIRHFSKLLNVASAAYEL